MSRFPEWLTTVTVVACTAVATGAGGGSLAEEALALCHAATRRDVVREDVLARGLALAEAAVARDEADARAHLAVFCNLGRITRSRGVGLGTLADVRRLVRIIEVAARLSPDDPDVLAARGALLVELPRMLGGDPSTGEKLLRRALALAPANCEAAAHLARALAARGVAGEAAALHRGC